MGTLILIASVLGLGLGVVYTLFKPQWAILFIIILYPLEQLLTTASPFFTANAKALNLLIGGLALLGAGASFVGGRQPLRGYTNLSFVATILLYAWAIVGIVFSPDREKGVNDLTAGLPYLGLLLVFPGLLVNRLEDFRRLVVPLMLIGSCIIVLILLSPKTTMFGGRLGIEGSGGRDGPEILNPLATAGLGGTIVILGMLYKPTSMAWIIHLIRAAAITIGLIIALLSGSRGQLLGAVFCGVAMFPFARQIKNLIQFFTVAASAGIALVLIMLVLTFATTRDAATRFSGEALGEGVDTRANLITTMLGEYLGNPVAIIQGLGTSSFDYYWTLDDTPYIHNMPAQILTENGLVGLGLLTVVMVLLVRESISLLRLHRDSPRDLSTVAILIAFCIYQLLLSLKQGSWFTSGAPFWAFLMLSKIHARSMLDARAYAQWEALQSDYDDEGSTAAA